MLEGARADETVEAVVAKVMAALRRAPMPLTSETVLQREMSALFDREGIVHKREVRLSGADVVDFMFPAGVAMEVKIKAQKRAIYRQCERYCLHASVRGLILATATATGFPQTVAGKPCWVVSLGSAWL